MKRVIKKKRSIRVDRVSMVVLMFSVLLSLFSTVFLRAYNNDLTKSIQQIEKEIVAIETANEAYEVAVQNLSSKDRVMEIAEMEGLALNQSSVITVSD